MISKRFVFIKKLLLKILRKIEMLEENLEKENVIKPIIFMNTPIDDAHKDVIGIHASVSAIEQAISDGAKMIGVIAEYGTGKTSLIELLIKRRKESKVIRVNLWDTLSEEQKKDVSINSLTKSFIYQLAMGKSSYRAGYVNKILNDNYGIIAFSTGLIRTWILLVMAAVFETIYLILGEFSKYTLKVLIPDIDSRWAYVLNDFAPSFQFIALVLVGIALLDASIAYSHWKSENRRTAEIGEIFSAYSYIHKCMRRWRTPTLIVIEDLDRIDKKDKITSFLKELYRFNNLCHSNFKKDPVFLIAIAPESRLEIASNVSKKIYSKVFDYVIALKPIHFDDYKIVLQEIIDSEPDKKKRLDEILSKDEKFIDGNLSSAFEWLYKGKNLTLRDLKDRLNQAIGLYVDLKNKQYIGDSSISFKTCASVTYLEKTYEKEYFDLIEDETKLANLIQESFFWKNDAAISNLELFEEKLITKYGDSRLIRNIAELIYDGILDADYRMYIYTFPKNSYIKNMDEKDICNYLEYPRDYEWDTDEIGEKMSRLKSSKRLESVRTAIQRIAKTEDIKYYPRVIFEDEFLFLNAYQENPSKCISSLGIHLIWWGEEVKRSSMVIKKVRSYLKDGDFWKEYCVQLLDECDLLAQEETIKMRKSLIEIFQDEIIYFKNLFVENEEDRRTVIFITEDEIKMINDTSISFKLVDKKQINLENFINIEVLFENQLYEEQLNDAIEIYKVLFEKESFKLIAQKIYLLMFKNEIIVDEFFMALCDLVQVDEFSQADFILYLNVLDTQIFTDEQLKKLNDLELGKELNESIIQRLLSKQCYELPLKYYCKTNNLHKINFANHIDEIVSACKKINIENKGYISQIRYELIRQNNGLFWKEYKSLFWNEYPLVSIKELRIFAEFEDAMYAIKGEKLNLDNVQQYIEFINESIHESAECFSIFDNLFNGGNLGCTDVSVIETILNGLDYNKIKIMTLSEEEIENIVQWLNSPLKLQIIDNVMNLMRQMRFLHPKYETLIIQKKGKESYINFINEMNMCTDYTINWIVSQQPSWKLNTNILNRLFKDGYFEYYVVGKVLFYTQFVYPMDEISDEILVKLFYLDSPIFEYLVSCDAFIQMLFDEKIYANFEKPVSIELMKPFYKLDQTAHFMQFVFDNATDNEILEYLGVFHKIKNQEESVDIAKILMDNVKYIMDDDIYSHVKHQLWENSEHSRGRKGALTKKRNEYLKELKK